MRGRSGGRDGCTWRTHCPPPWQCFLTRGSTELDIALNTGCELLGERQQQQSNDSLDHYYYYTIDSSQENNDGESLNSSPLPEAGQQPVLDLPQVRVQLVLLLWFRAPLGKTSPCVLGRGVLRKNGPVGVYPPFLLRVFPVQRNIYIGRLYRLLRLRLSSFLSPSLPLLSAEAANVKENPDEREDEAEDDEPLQNEKGKGLDVGVNCEELVD